MSYKHLTYDGIDDKNLIIDNLTINDALSIGNLEATNLEITNDLTVDNNITCLNSLLISQDLLVGNNGSITGDLEVKDQLVSSGLSDDLSSVVEKLISSGSHTWNSGINNGVNPLTIGGLDGNNYEFLKLYISFTCTITNEIFNYLQLNFNLNTTNNYGWAYQELIQKTSVQNTSINNPPIIYSDDAGFNVGLGEFLINSKQINNRIFANGNVYYQNGSLNQRILSGGISYVSLIDSNMSSLTIDVSNNQHEGWTIDYKLTRLR